MMLANFGLWRAWVSSGKQCTKFHVDSNLSSLDSCELWFCSIFQVIPHGWSVQCPDIFIKGTTWEENYSTYLQNVTVVRLKFVSSCITSIRTTVSEST